MIDKNTLTMPGLIDEATGTTAAERRAAMDAKLDRDRKCPTCGQSLNSKQRQTLESSNGHA